MSQTANPAPDTRAWYQHRMMLMVVGIPMLSVVVSFTFLAIAIYTFDGVVVDDYYKQGKEINRVLARDQMAVDLGLEAGVKFNPGVVDVAVSSGQSIDWPERLTLGILHPTQDGKDINVELHLIEQEQVGADGTGILLQRHYQGNSREFEAGEWILQLETPLWRLTHRLSLTPDAAVRFGFDHDAG